MRARQRFAVVAMLTAGLVAAGLVSAAGAWAHVTVAAPGVVAGQSDAQISFRVPNESDSAATVGLTLQLPTDHPIAGVLVAPMQGWSAKIVRSKLAQPIKTDDGDITEVVSRIDWRAGAGAGVQPGFVGLFTIVAGKLPDGVDSLTFKAIQTYSDGTTVSWIEQPAPGSDAQPDHPAPVLHLTRASQPTDSSPPPAAARASAGLSGGSGGSGGIATAGLVIACIAAALAAAALVVTLRRRPRTQRGRPETSGD